MKDKTISVTVAAVWVKDGRSIGVGAGTTMNPMFAKY